MSENKLFNFRKNYTLGELDEVNVPANPFVFFEIWFGEAIDANIIEPNAMVLSTADINNMPSSRAVLLKKFSDEGFEFYTNYNSRKSLDIAVNKQASLLFLWLSMERQIRIEGKVLKVSRNKSVAYFKKRPRESQINAWVSEQSTVIESKQHLLERKKNIEQLYNDKEVKCPPHWGGFLHVPTQFEFWQGGLNRLHDRIAYKLHANVWHISRLAP